MLKIQHEYDVSNIPEIDVNQELEGMGKLKKITIAG